MFTKNLKIFFVSFAASIPLWWGMNALSKNLENFFLDYHMRANAEFLASVSSQLEQNLQDAYPLRKRGIEPVEFQAVSVLSLYVKEHGSTKVLFEKQPHISLPIASISKLMTALVALQTYPLDQRIVVTPAILETLGEAGYLRSGDVLTVRDLLHVALMESSNDAALALAEPLGRDQFVALMNKEAARLNLSNTSFVNPTGLDEKNAGNVSTAWDLAEFARYLFDHYPQIFDILSQSELPLYNPDKMFHHMMRNTNQFLGYYEWPARTLGGKTGTTAQAKQTLLLLVESPDRDGYIINVILGSENRFYEMRALLLWILESYQWKT